MFRALLLAAKQVTAVPQAANHSLPLKEKLKAELSMYVLLGFFFFISFTFVDFWNIEVQLVLKKTRMPGGESITQSFPS